MSNAQRTEYSYGYLAEETEIVLTSNVSMFERSDKCQKKQLNS